MFPLAFAFGGGADIAIICGVVVLLFGGAKIASFGRSLGEGIKEFKKATKEEDEPVVMKKDEAKKDEPAVGAGSKSEEK